MKATRLWQWFTAFIALVLPTFSALGLSRQPLDVLFVAFDQGDSNVFLQLERALGQTSIHYKVVTLGQADEITWNNTNSLAIAPTRKADFKKNRGLPLAGEELEQALSTLNPRIVYSGMASTAQAQVLNAFRKQGSYTIAFYDNFDSVSDKDYVQPFLQEVNIVDEYHVPSQATALSFQDLSRYKGRRVEVTGQPALESWNDIYQKTNDQQLRKALKLPSTGPIILFAGGYNNSYEHYFRIFIEATRHHPGLFFLVTYHPKTDGSLEGLAIKDNTLGNVLLVEKGSFSSIALSKISNAVIVHKSSIGPQALYKQKPVIYLAEDSFENFLTKKGLAPRVSTPETLSQALEQALTTVQSNSIQEELGMPDGPSEKIIKLLQQHLKM